MKRRSAGRVALAACLLLLTAAAREEARPRRPSLSERLARSRVVVLAHVEGVASLDAGRIHVARLSVARVIKGAAGSGAEDGGGELSVVVVRDLPALAPRLGAGEWVVAFLRPLRWTSSLRAALARGSYFESASGRDGIVSGSDRSGAEEVAAVLERLAAASREPERDGGKRRSAERASVVAEVSAHHPALVADGASRLAALSSPLEAGERSALERALARPELDDAVRAELIDAIAAAGLSELAPAVAQAPGGGRVDEARWRALEALGAPPDADMLRERLGADDGRVRAAAAEEMLRSADPEARETVVRLAREDPEARVRSRLLAAMGRSMGSAALPVLEAAMAEDTSPLARQAAARAIFSIGGEAARAALARAAFRGPLEEQRRAVAMLRALGAGDDDPLLARIRREHPDPRAREIATSGLPWHPH